MHTIRKCAFITGLWFVVSAPVISFAEEPCAKVAVVIGRAYDLEGSSLKTGEALSEGTTVETGPTSLLKLVLRDDSIIDMGSSSRLKILSCQGKTWATHINLELENGEIRALVNKARRAKREEFKVKTLTSVLAVRGTEFFVSWQQDASGQVVEQIGVSEGRVEVRSLFTDSLKPVSLNTGTEFRAEGRAERSEEGQIRVETSTPPQVDQFTADEQRQAEQKTKVESKVFEKAVDLSTESSDRSQKDKNTGSDVPTESNVSQAAQPPEPEPQVSAREPAEPKKVAQFISATLETPPLEKRRAALPEGSSVSISIMPVGARESADAEDVEVKPRTENLPTRIISKRSESERAPASVPVAPQPNAGNQAPPAAADKPVNGLSSVGSATAIPTSVGSLPPSIFPGSAVITGPVVVSIPVVVQWGLVKK